MKKVEPKPLATIQFLEFWLAVANDLGNARLWVNKNATNIHELFVHDNDNRAYLRDIIKKSYTLSHCQHLNSGIDLETVLDLLGATAYKLQGDQRDDLFDIELLEEIVWHINSHHSIHVAAIVEKTRLEQDKARQDINAKSSKFRNKARILSFPNFKIRRANSLL